MKHLLIGVNFKHIWINARIKYLFDTKTVITLVKLHLMIKYRKQSYYFKVMIFDTLGGWLVAFFGIASVKKNAENFG